MDKGNIIKISNGHYTETAKADHVAYARNINTNAAKKINEQASDGIKYDKAPPRKLVNPDQVDVTIAVFFDGTGNNKNNTLRRLNYNNPKTALKDKKIYKDNTDDNSSYENDYSNVARLWQNYVENPGKYVYKQYIEGIGTTNDAEDDSKGTATGSGPTGIAKKVASGCSEISKKLNTVLSGKPTRIIHSLTVDVFGFSRGAAAARHFVHEITKPAYAAKVVDEYVSTGPYSSAQHIHYMLDDMNNETTIAQFPFRGYLGAYCQKANVQIKTLIVRFVGLFDCVASFNDGYFIPPIGSDTPKQFKNNSKLHLDAIAVAQRVIHFTASDEHRGNFPLTTIASAGSKGRSFSFPGVHSDVGGCYKDSIEEKINPLYVMGSYSDMEKEKERLVAQGWFNKDEIFITEDGFLASDRKGVRNTYSFIPLHLMANCGINYTSSYAKDNPMRFNVTQKIENQFSINGDAVLVKVKQRMEAQVFKGTGPLTFKYYQDVLTKYHVAVNSPKPPECNAELEEQKNLRQLRHHYLHWNSTYEAVYGVLHPMYPRLDHGKRQRFVIPG